MVLWCATKYRVLLNTPALIRQLGGRSDGTEHTVAVARPSDAKYWKNNEGVLGAKFDFVWTKLSKDLVTGNAIWTVDDVSNCVSLHKLQKLDPLKKDVIKIQIVNNLLLPCLYACQTHLHGTPQEGLLALPAEVTSQILKNLPAASLCSLAVVHPLLRFLTSEPKLWESRFKKDFPLAKPSVTLGTNWKELYKTEYLAGRAIYRRSAVLPTSRRHYMNNFDPSAAFLSDLGFFREHTRFGSGMIRLV